MVAGFLQHGLERIELVGGERPWSRPVVVPRRKAATHLRRRGGRGGRTECSKGTRATPRILRGTVRGRGRRASDGSTIETRNLRRVRTRPARAAADRTSDGTSSPGNGRRKTVGAPGPRPRVNGEGIRGNATDASHERRKRPTSGTRASGRNWSSDRNRSAADAGDTRHAGASTTSTTAQASGERIGSTVGERSPTTAAGPGRNTGSRRGRSGRSVALEPLESRSREREDGGPRVERTGTVRCHEDREVERQRRPPEAEAARKSRGNLGRTAGGEQSAVMRTGCRRGQNLCRVRTVGTTHAIRINRSGETPEAARPWDDTGETGDGARSPPQGSSRRSRRSTRG